MFRVTGYGLRVTVGVQGSGFRVLVRVLVLGSVLRVQGSGFRVQGSGFRYGFRV